MTADFAQLYSQLGIRTDCSLDEFKHACRRRIRDQHPDRTDADAAGDATRIPLNELLSLYAKALRFHRKHGRLPGAAPIPVPAQAMTPARERPFPPPPIANSVSTSASTSTVSRASLRGPLLIVLAIVGVMVVVGLWSDETPAPAPSENAQAAPVAAETDAERIADRLEIGMDVKTVLEIQGEPTQQDGTEWLYGPSWLRFEHNRLVDWYSSPLYPLKTATSAPSDDSGDGESETGGDGNPL